MKLHHHYNAAKTLAHLLDNQFSFFGFRFGLDPVIGIFPWLGNALTTLLSFYIIYIARAAKLEDRYIKQMMKNVVIDFILGFIPLFGIVADFFYKSNSKNIKILEKHMPSELIEGSLVEPSQARLAPG